MQADLSKIKNAREGAPILVTHARSGNCSMSEAVNFLEKELEIVRNIRSARSRNGLLWALGSLREKLSEIKEMPKNGLVMFVGKTEDASICEVMEPTSPVKSFYICDLRFHPEMLEFDKF